LCTRAVNYFFAYISTFQTIIEMEISANKRTTPRTTTLPLPFPYKERQEQVRMNYRVLELFCFWIYGEVLVNKKKIVLSECYKQQNPNKKQ
jgi:hypothetical protein